MPPRTLPFPLVCPSTTWPVLGHFSCCCERCHTSRSHQCEAAAPPGQGVEDPRNGNVLNPGISVVFLANLADGRREAPHRDSIQQRIAVSKPASHTLPLTSSFAPCLLAYVARLACFLSLACVAHHRTVLLNVFLFDKLPAARMGKKGVTVTCKAFPPIKGFEVRPGHLCA